MFYLSDKLIDYLSRVSSLVNGSISFSIPYEIINCFLFGEYSTERLSH
jgi:hypothetical protein